MRIISRAHARGSRGLLLAVLALGGVLICGVSAGAAEDKPWSLMGGYAVEEGAFFDGTYHFNPAWQLNLSRLDRRLQMRASYLPVPNLALEAGYDLTKEQYLAGLKYRRRLGENIAVLAKATGYRRREVNKYSLDYQGDLEIGIGGDNLAFAGIRGEYIPGTAHDPEIYIRMDFNWYFGENWRLRFEPLILVEGRIDHQTTVSRKWENGTEAGLYFKNDEFLWDAGIFVKM